MVDGNVHHVKSFLLNVDSSFSSAVDSCHLQFLISFITIRSYVHSVEKNDFATDSVASLCLHHSRRW